MKLHFRIDQMIILDSHSSCPPYILQQNCAHAQKRCIKSDKTLSHNECHVPRHQKN